MPRFLSHLLLLLYAGVFLHCQPLPGPAASVASSSGSPQEQSGTGLCKKKLQTVQADPAATAAQQPQAKLLPLDLCLGGDFAALYFGLLFPADQPTLTLPAAPTPAPRRYLPTTPTRLRPSVFLRKSEEEPGAMPG